MPSCITKKNNGFALIELMVVLVIMVALTILVLTGYSESFPRLALERSAETFIHDVYSVREKAFSSFSYSEDFPESNHGLSIKQGEDSYEVFVEHSGGKEVIKKTDTDRGVRIGEVYPTEELKITFLSSERKILFNGVEPTENARIVFYSKENSNLTREVIINPKGIAEVVEYE